MDAKAINKFPIREYLAAQGIRPAKDRSYYGLYHSPLREDRTPSMKVDYDKNLWIDYGAGEGGTLIDLVMRMERCSAGEAMRRLEQRISETPAFSFHGYSNPVPPHHESVITIEQICPLENPALLAYLTERSIDLAAARAHCSEVHYRVAGKSYFAIGFRNDAGGWELRNRYFKGCTSKAPTTRRGDYPSCLVFEGFMDYLSFLTLRLESCPQYPDFDRQDYMVLNSVANVSKALYPLGSYERIHCFFDNDRAGMEALRQIRKEYDSTRHIRDASQIYCGCKDLNEYLQKRMADEQMQSVRKKNDTLSKKPKGFRL